MRCILLLWLLLPTATLAQGFNQFSGRNHPELDWQVAETPHFRIMYPAHLAGIEAEAAAIAETTYAVLSHNLSVTFDQPLRLYLSDEDEITNGFAVPIGNGYTNIWVHLNDAAHTWTGREKWLRKVIAHELTHLFHYQAVRGNLGAFDYFFGNPLPRFWTEGLAQYQTEAWDAYRGDRWLRTAVLDDQLDYDDGRSAWNGRLLYAVGNAQVRYFADQYGDSTLVKLLHHRKRVLLGLGRVHDFQTAFKATTGQSWTAFDDRWRRMVNLYYNTLAAHMQPLDSLQADTLDVPGQYLYDLRFSPDSSKLAVLALTALRRPVRRLVVVDRKTQQVQVVAEGTIQPPVAWSPDGKTLAYARTTRGAHGSLLNDLYLVDADGQHRRRLTYSRRASSPVFSPDGQQLAFAGSTNGTSNLFLLDLATRRERPLTRYTGDVQLGAIAWHPQAHQIAFACFDADGTRDLRLLDLATDTLRVLTDGLFDDRGPVWHPDGTHLAYTSLRDRVPNVFVLDLATNVHHRITELPIGATVHDWLPPDSAHASGQLVLSVGVSKNRDRAFLVDAGRTVALPSPMVPAAYARWIDHRPPRQVPSQVMPAPTLIRRRTPYRAWRNLTHVTSFALPYYNDPDDWGVFGSTTWLEPLAKHAVAFVGGLSFASFREESFFTASYLNNTRRPTLGLNLYRLPSDSRFYGNDLLVESFEGGEMTMQWPLDVLDRPYASLALSARLRYADVEPLGLSKLDLSDDRLPLPEAGQLADLRLGLTFREQRPWKDNVVHPLDGFGLRAQVTGAARMVGADRSYLRGETSAWAVLPGLGLQRFYVYGRAQAQTGRALAQDFLGFSRYDQLQLPLPGALPLSFGDLERVRGYRPVAVGNRVLFGSLEYRIPLVPDLYTQVLGLVALGSTTLTAFADGGLVWTDAAFDTATRRLGVGFELKNALHLGPFELLHAVGVAQPYDQIGAADYDLYYRLRTAVAF